MTRAGAIFIWLSLFLVPSHILAVDPPQPSTSNPNEQAVDSGPNPADTSSGSGDVASGGSPVNLTAAESATVLTRDIAQSPLFALASGIASIIGLLFTLYATQVRTIPFSLYRSLMWRKALLLSTGVGLLIFGSIKFHAQEQSPFLSPFRELHALLFGYVTVSPVDNEPHGTFIWAVIGIVGLLIFAIGIIYEPAALARRILIREQDALHKALDVQVDHLLNGRRVADLERHDRRVLRDTLDYFRHVQWRFTDVVLGAPPPTFPLSFVQRQQNVADDAFDSASESAEPEEG